VGKHFRRGDDDVEVIGIARDGKYSFLGEKPQIFAYFAFAQYYNPRMSLHVRTDAQAAETLNQIREVVATHVPNPELRTAILTLIDEADGDLDRARRNIEDWYDAMMGRVSGWYKRHTTVLMLALGCLVAAGINADTVTIATALSNDAALRSAVVSAAEQRAATPLTAPVTDGAVDSLSLPLGWVGATAQNAADPRRIPGTAQGWLLKVFGILLTGLAISQGSPFWFDLLNKFIIVRSTVKPAEKKDADGRA